MAGMGIWIPKRVHSSCQSHSLANHIHLTIVTDSQGNCKTSKGRILNKNMPPGIVGRRCSMIRHYTLLQAH
jgi:hypothetical protein